MQQKRKRKLVWISLGFIAVIVASALFVVGSILWSLSEQSNLPLLEPFPAYPNAIKLDKGYTVTSFDACGNIFDLEKSEIFATKDSLEQVNNFYAQAAKKMTRDYTEEYSGNGNVVCLGNIRTRRGPTNVVVILDSKTKPEDVRVDMTMPNVPADTTIVVLLQGFVYLE